MNIKRKNKLARKRRIRAVISGAPDRPRLALYRSNKSLYAQLIDDINRRTIAASRATGKNSGAAKKLGENIAQLAKKNAIATVVFDRGGNRYHGIVRIFADAAREGGLKI